MVRFASSTWTVAVLALASFASSAAIPETSECEKSKGISNAHVGSAPVGNTPTGHIENSPAPVDNTPAPVDNTPASGNNSTSSGSSSLSSEVYKGHTTWYGGCTEEDCWQNGPCAFVDYKLPAGIDGTTCISEAYWDNSAHCGACVEINYKGTKKIAMITNKTDKDGDINGAIHLDLTPSLFSKFANKGIGRFDTTWKYVACPITTPLEIRMHGGSSRWWFAATVVNAQYGTDKLEVSADQGKTWKPTVRDVNNFFKLAGNGGTNTDTAWVRVTSVTGSQIVVKDVVMGSGKSTKATANYK